MMPEHAALFDDGPRMRPGSNVQMTGRDGVYTFSARPVPVAEEATQAAEATHPFLCPAVANASEIVAGTVNGVTATNLGVVVDTSGTKHVYVDVTYSQDLSPNNYVRGISGSITCAMATGSSVPSDTSTHLYRLIATYVNGQRTVQAIISSLQVEARDNGTGTATTRAIWGGA